MTVSVKEVSDMLSKDVFTNKGFYVGKINELEFDLTKYKVRALVGEAAKGSAIGKMVGNKRGVVVPYSMVQSVGDVVIMKHISETSFPEEGMEELPAK